jgi:restriction system protein
VGIPAFDDMYSEALLIASKTNGISPKDFRDPLAETFGLTEDERHKEYDSGNGNVFLDRISWCLSALFRIGLLEKPKRGIYVITDYGRKILAENNTNSKIKISKKQLEGKRSEDKSQGNANNELNLDAPKKLRNKH